MATNGNDTIIGSQKSDLLNGLYGNDIIRGLGGNDKLYGSRGNDTLDGGTGGDTLIGGLGDDLYIIDNVADLIIEKTPNEGYDTVRTTVTMALPFGVERGIVSGKANIGMYGNTLNNTLIGQAGRNKLWGGDGNDTISGQGGNDDLGGGEGNDYLVGGDGRDIFRPGFGHDRVNGLDPSANSSDYPYDTLVINYGSLNIQVTLSATGGNINASGLHSVVFSDIERFEIKTGSGNDNLVTGAGNDILDGGSGDDTLKGGAGDDNYFIDSAGDVIIESVSGGTMDRMTSSISTVARANVEYSVLAGSAVSLTGLAQQDHLTGTNNNNSLQGEGGNDFVYGLGGDDVLEGGTGTDQLTGGAGQDTLTGDADRDILSGGSGADIFRFLDVSDSFGALPAEPLALGDFDHILDFNSTAGDLIDLSAIDADSTTGGNQAFIFIGPADFHNVAGEVRVGTYVVGMPGTDEDQELSLIEADINGDGVADFRVGFEWNLAPYSASDYLL